MAPQTVSGPIEARLHPVSAVDGSKRPSSVLSSQSQRSGGYWNNLLCIMSGLNPDESKPAGATSITNRDYFNDQPSPPRTPILRTRSSKNSVTGSSRASVLRPSFSTRRSSRSIFRRFSSRGTSYEIQEESELEPEPKSPCEPVLEESMPSAFEASILSTIPGTVEPEPMISVEHDGQAIWIPQHVIDLYAPQSAMHRLGNAAPLKLSIPQWTPSGAVKRTSDEHGQTLTLVNTYSSQGSSESSFQSSSPSSSHRSKDSCSGSSIESPSVDTPGSVYSSDGTSSTSLELKTPTDAKSFIAPQQGDYSVPDPCAIGIFDDQLTPPPVQPRNPRRSFADAQQEIEQTPVARQARGDARRELHFTESGSPEPAKPSAEPNDALRANAPPVPQRSQRRSEAEVAPKKRPTRSKSVGDMSLAVVNEQPEDARVNSDAAENIIYNIFLAVQSLPDLFALGQINHGFHAVYKRFQLALVKNALRNDCSAAWELREASEEDVAANDATQSQRARAYLEALRRDFDVLNDLKGSILEHCAFFLRASTVFALQGKDAEAERRLDEALWRIWTFCALFTDSPSDVETQVAWLRSVERNSGTPLTAAQLFDMTELWNCVASLLSNAVIAPEGSLEQARAAGVIHKQADNACLDGWLEAQLTRGPATVFDLTAVAAEPTADVFAFAAQMGWIATGDADAAARGAFLKDAVGRVYCERLAGERGEVEIASPKPISPSVHGALELDESHVHPALRRLDQVCDAPDEGFVTPRSGPSAASSSYSTRPVTPAY